MILNRYLGINELPNQAKSLIQTFLFIQLINSFLMSMSSTFYILNAIDHIGFTLAGVMTSVLLLTQVILDYPSGSLGDYIGQRWVLGISYGCYGFGFFLLTTANDFTSFLIAAIINGIGFAQASGTLNTWLDSNYQKVATVDTERKIYGYARSRVNTIDNLGLAASFMSGGIIATIFSRQTVFFIQFIMAITMIAVVLLYVKDIESDELNLLDPQVNPDTKSRGSYFNYIRGGINFVFSSKVVFLFILGLATLNVTFTIWGNLILFPLYFGYTGSDAGASLLRTIIYLNGIPLGLYVANFSRRFSTDGFPKLLWLFLFLFFPAFITLFFLNPIENSFNFVGFIITILIMNISVSFVFRTADVLRMRFMVDLVPSKNRNSVYSLIPTITSLLSIPILPFVGQIIDQYSLAAGTTLTYGVYILSVILITVAIILKKSASEKVQVKKSIKTQSTTVGT
ncbi:MAG: MFS transporter [Candidatus Hodarchaeales archaeon]|jgi:MFS family permease